MQRETELCAFSMLVARPCSYFPCYLSQTSLCIKYNAGCSNAWLSGRKVTTDEFQLLVRQKLAADCNLSSDIISRVLTDITTHLSLIELKNARK